MKGKDLSLKKKSKRNKIFKNKYFKINIIFIYIYNFNKKSFYFFEK